MREQSKTVLCRLLLVGFAAMVIVALVPAKGYAQFVPNSKQSPLCQKLGTQIQGSSGMQMYCFGPQPNGAAPRAGLLRPGVSGTPLAAQKPTGGKGGFTPNVNAANLAEDISPSGVRAFGQSETSIAAAGSYVVEAWNDSTGFFAPCGSPNNKEELTGFAFSNDGGNTFTDLGGVPNLNCATSKSEGDPSVEAYQVGGNTYFYISSIFIPFNVPQNALSVTACQVTGSGSSATLSCGQPIIAAISSDCINVGFTFCSFLDKEFLSLDAARGKLSMSYTEFGFTDADGAGQINLAVCDLTVNPANPTCSNGSGFSFLNPLAVPAYLVVSANNNNFCEQEGAYPAVDPASGDVYVAFEFNWATNQNSFGPCAVTPTQEVLAHIPRSCLTATSPSPCLPPFSEATVNIVSTDATFVPGYNRFPSNDFPRIAVSNAAGTVSIVWNDAKTNPLGDILMQSYNLGSLIAVQSAPVKLNNDTTNGALHFLPAVRNADSNGRLSVSWYDRRLNPSSAITHVFAALGVDPRTTSTPSNSRVTDVSSDWLAVSSDIVPNFGDYTDNYVVRGTGKHASNISYFAWSDGRLGDPQPFEAHH